MRARQKMKRWRSRAQVGKFGSFQRKTAESATLQPPNSICPALLRETPQQGVGVGGKMKQKQRKGGEMPIGADTDGRGGKMQPERDLSEEMALAGGGSEKEKGGR